MTVAVALVAAAFISAATAAPTKASLDGPNCKRRCGDMDIPYPLGVENDCYLNDYFNITCVNDSKPFSGTLPVLNISLADGEPRVMMFTARYCYNQTGSLIAEQFRWMELTLPNLRHQKYLHRHRLRHTRCSPPNTNKMHTLATIREIQISFITLQALADIPRTRPSIVTIAILSTRITRRIDSFRNFASRIPNSPIDHHRHPFFCKILKITSREIETPFFNNKRIATGIEIPHRSMTLKGPNKNIVTPDSDWHRGLEATDPGAIPVSGIGDSAALRNAPGRRRVVAGGDIDGGECVSTDGGEGVFGVGGSPYRQGEFRRSGLVVTVLVVASCEHHHAQITSAREMFMTGRVPENGLE